MYQQAKSMLSGKTHQSSNAKGKTLGSKSRPVPAPTAANDFNPVRHRLTTYTSEHTSYVGSNDVPSDHSNNQRCCKQEGSNSLTKLQAKLTVGTPDDEYEREADTIAARVMRMPVTPSPPVEEEDEEESPELQSKMRATPFMQRVCAHCENDLRRQPARSIALLSLAQGFPAILALRRMTSGNGVQPP